MPVIKSSIEYFYSVAETLPVINRVLAIKYVFKCCTSILIRYVHSGVELMTKYGAPIVDAIDNKLDGMRVVTCDVRNFLMNKYNCGKDEVITKAKGYKTAISEQVSTTIAQTNVSELKSRVEESVKQAPEVVRSLSNKAVSLTKQGLEISIGHEKTESVLNTVRTHTPRFVTSLLTPESAGAPAQAVVVAH
jgi:hypothetical protein